jgi:hypothetical protein
MASESGNAFEPETDGLDELSILGHPETRRRFIKRVAAF